MPLPCGQGLTANQTRRRMRQSDPRGQQRRCCGWKHTERNLWKREGRILLREDEVARQGELESAAEAASADERGGGCGRVQQVVDEGVHLGQDPTDLVRGVFRDGRAEAEVSPRACDRYQLEVRILRDPLECGPQRSDHFRRDDVALGMEERDGSARVVRVECDAYGGAHCSSFLSASIDETGC